MKMNINIQHSETEIIVMRSYRSSLLNLFLLVPEIAMSKFLQQREGLIMGDINHILIANLIIFIYPVSLG